MSPGILDGQQPVGTAQPVDTQNVPPASTEPPDMQNQMDMFLSNGMSIIHSKKVSDGLIKTIKSATGDDRQPDPLVGVANATLNVLDRLEASAGEKGVNLPPEYVAEAGNVLMGEIFQIAEAAGLGPFSEQERYKAFSLAVSKYIDQGLKSGKITEEQLQELSAQVEGTPEGQQVMAQAEQGPAGVQ